MFSFIIRKVMAGLARSQVRSGSVQDEEKVQINISKTLSENINSIKNIMSGSSDLITREFAFGGNQPAVLFYVDGLIDSKIINVSIIEPLMDQLKVQNLKSRLGNISVADIARNIISVDEVKESKDQSKAVEGVLTGNAVVLIDGFDSCLIISSKGWDKRTISAPSSESVVRGPRESFTENLLTNTSMIRRKIKSPDLAMETMALGSQTQTLIALAYIKGIANTELIQDIKERLNTIHTDSILESGYIEQFIEDAPFSLFATVGNTERPDVVAAKLLEGRIAIVVDGTPVVLTAPLLFIENFQTSEDYYSRPYFMSMLRIVRYLAFFASVLVPGVFVAITTYNQELIPTDLLFTMSAARESIPFPAFEECFIMLTAFEILREAGVRLPQTVGQAMSIVGALVLGQAAVSAGIVSTPMVIVVAITAVSIFAIPSLADAAAILRIIFLILGGTMGGFGIIIGLLGTLVHLSSLKSFGFPYLSPIAPFQAEDTKDIAFRSFLWLMISRPMGMAHRNMKRKDYMVPPAKESDYNSEAN